MPLNGERHPSVPYYLPTPCTLLTVAQHCCKLTAHTSAFSSDTVDLNQFCAPPSDAPWELIFLIFEFSLHTRIHCYTSPYTYHIDLWILLTLEGHLRGRRLARLGLTGMGSVTRSDTRHDSASSSRSNMVDITTSARAPRASLRHAQNTIHHMHALSRLLTAVLQRLPLIGAGFLLGH